MPGSAGDRPYVAVIGSAGGDERSWSLAEQVGRGLGERGAVLVCGGLGGVMEAACRGAKGAGGTTVGVLSGFASTCLPAYMTDDEQRTYRIHRQNALRQLIATSPDSQTS